MEQQALTFKSWEEFVQEFTSSHITEEVIDNSNSDLTFTLTCDREILFSLLRLNFEGKHNNEKQVREILKTITRNLLLLLETTIRTPEAKQNLYRELEQVVFFPQHSIQSIEEERLLLSLYYQSISEMYEENRRQGRFSSGYRQTIRDTYPKMFRSIVAMGLQINTPPLLILQNVIGEKT